MTEELERNLIRKPSRVKFLDWPKPELVSFIRIPEVETADITNPNNAFITPHGLNENGESPGHTPRYDLPFGHPEAVIQCGQPSIGNRSTDEVSR
ncbi:hypothetical protein [Thioalkalivibrio sp. ALE11]|uniref:hypothetical protein n=1 Tax=Thioalkalivibrio sp. ALE11 TaxID=1265494 RepID=UPI0012DE26CD|nr:hypothetical protein [Thioalkalivibrio sp. ALE11]